MPTPEQHIILFDGICNLCNGAVRFIIRRDPAGRFQFATLQSETAKKLLDHHSYPREDPGSVIYIKNGKIYLHSDAVLQICKQLPFPWPVFSVMRIFPKGFRDAVYRFIARNRYRWFGKRETCIVPTDKLKQRFL